jgi:hypothetical protein
MRGEETAVNFFDGPLQMGQPRLQCIPAAFPNAMHTLSTGSADDSPRIFSMCARAVQVYVEIA